LVPFYIQKRVLGSDHKEDKLDILVHYMGHYLKWLIYMRDILGKLVEQPLISKYINPLDLVGFGF
jgi:hypothetical protein